MRPNQIKFLAKNFCDNLDISDCDPETSEMSWSTYIQEERPENKYAKALSLLWIWTIEWSSERLNVEKILSYVIKNKVIVETFELLHEINEDLNEQQFELFHKIEEYSKTGKRKCFNTFDLDKIVFEEKDGAIFVTILGIKFLGGTQIVNISELQNNYRRIFWFHDSIIIIPKNKQTHKHLKWASL